MSDIFTNPLWWYWVVFGLILVVSEIVVPSFVIIWFGLAGIVVGCLDYIVELSFKQEIGLWTVLSVVFTILWFKVFKPKDLTNKGQTGDDMGTVGQVLESVSAIKKGKVVFEKPILGSSTWIVTADSDISKDERVVAVKVIGNMIKVRKDK